MYKFKHEVQNCKLNPVIFTAFDTRYSSKRTLFFNDMYKYFTEGYISKFKNSIARKPLTQCWPEFSKIIWTVEDGKLYSQIKTMKTMHGLTLGVDTKEQWIFEGNLVSEVIECED